MNDTNHLVADSCGSLDCSFDELVADNSLHLQQLHDTILVLALVGSVQIGKLGGGLLSELVQKQEPRVVVGIGWEGQFGCVLYGQCVSGSLAVGARGKHCWSRWLLNEAK